MDRLRTDDGVKMKCPETIEELEELERLLPLCRKTLYETARAKMESGAAYSRREAERQIAEETGRPLSTVRSGIQREQLHNLDALHPLCEKEEQVAHLEPLCEKKDQPPICTIWTGDTEWFTPAKYIEAARAVMGSIDLDPASNDEAQEIIQAATYFTKEDNGLNKPWRGNIFLNPPYSHPHVKYFVDKLLSELKAGQQAILLTNNNTDTNFFHNAARQATAVCFTKGRINFLKADGSYSSPTNGQVFYYFGNNKEEFIKYFSEFGILMEVI